MARPSKGEKPSPVRKRVSIPATDVSTLEWFAAQEDPSVSVRLVIRDWITRHGAGDVLSEPVSQQPRRGRPPGSTSETEDGTENGSEEYTEPVRSEPEPEPAPVPRPAPARKPEPVPRPISALVQARPGAGVEPDPDADAAFDINDMIGAPAEEAGTSPAFDLKSL